MNGTQSQFAWITLVFGLILCGGGLLYLTSSGQRRDRRLFSFLYYRLVQIIPFFRLLWPLGKTWFMIVVLIILYFNNHYSGFLAALVFGGIACLEKFIKLKVKRQRPFSVIVDVQMLQPRLPHDASHPSGDAMRVWYLAIIIPQSFGLPLPIISIFYCIASMVCLGRIAFGVHFPLDVVGGVGLGLTGAGLYQLFL